MGSRKTRQVETRLVSEYILSRYANFPILYDQGLGPVPDEYLREYGYQKGIGFYDPQRPHVDAIVLLPRHFLLIEAKVWEITPGLGKLPLYKALIPTTPELKQYQPRDVLMELVVGWTKPSLEIMAGSIGVKVVVFCPEWVATIVEERHNYQTPEYRLRREQILRERELLGLE